MTSALRSATAAGADRYSAVKAELLRRLLGRPVAGARVLDIGGGAGQLSLTCAGLGARVTLIHSDPGMLEAVQRLARDRGLTDSFQAICARGIPAHLARERFDVIVARNVLEHLPDDRAFLRDLAQCQQPGDRLLLSTQNRWSLNYLIEGTYRRWWCGERSWCGWHPDHKRFYTPPALERRLREAGYLPRRWAGAFLVPYNILSWASLFRRSTELAALPELDLRLGQLFPFNRLGWNLLVAAERGGGRRAVLPGGERRQRIRVRSPANPVRRLPPVYSPVTVADLANGARVSISGDDRRPALADSLGRHYDADAVLLTGSGTQALQCAIEAASRLVGGSRRVALPAFSCYDVAAAAVAVNAEIHLYDLDPSTLAPDPESLAKALAAGARIAVVAPLYGVPVDWDQVDQCVRAYGAVAIEDAAQGHGASWNSRPLGSHGRISVLSFGRGKGWTGGAGGAVLFRPPAVPDAKAVAAWEFDPAGGAVSLLGRVAAQAVFSHPTLYALPASVPALHLGETRYRTASRPACMSRAAAALLEASWPRATIEALNRRMNADVLLRGITLTSDVWPIRPPLGGDPGYLRLPVLLSNGLAGFTDGDLARRLGIAPSYPTTLAHLPPIAHRLRGDRGGFPGAADLVRRLVTLPTHSLATPDDRARMIELLETYPA